MDWHVVQPAALALDHKDITETDNEKWKIYMHPHYTLLSMKSFGDDLLQPSLCVVSPAFSTSFSAGSLCWSELCSSAVRDSIDLSALRFPPAEVEASWGGWGLFKVPWVDCLDSSKASRFREELLSHQRRIKQHPNEKGRIVYVPYKQLHLAILCIYELTKHFSHGCKMLGQGLCNRHRGIWIGKESFPFTVVISVTVHYCVDLTATKNMWTHSSRGLKCSYQQLVLLIKALQLSERVLSPHGWQLKHLQKAVSEWANMQISLLQC